MIEDDETRYEISLASITDDGFIDMKCTNCGHEDELPEWCYMEEVDRLKNEGITTPPSWQCPRCDKETLVRKPDTHRSFHF